MNYLVDSLGCVLMFASESLNEDKLRVLSFGTSTMTRVIEWDPDVCEMVRVSITRSYWK